MNPHSATVGVGAGGRGLGAGMAIGPVVSGDADCVTAYDPALPFAASSRGQQVIAAGLAHAIGQYFAPQPAS